MGRFGRSARWAAAAGARDEEPCRGDAWREPRPARSARPRPLRQHHAHRARVPHQAVRPRLRPRDDVLADESRGGVLREPASRAGDGGRARAQPWGLDALLVRDPRRARDRRAARRRDPPLERRGARRVAAEVGHPRPLRRRRRRQGRRGLPRGTCTASLGARGRGVTPPTGARGRAVTPPTGARGRAVTPPTGGEVTARADRLERLATEKGLDSLLVTNLANVRYLTGFTGTNGLCLVGGDLRLFLTDFRYVTQAAEQVEGFERAQGRQDLLGEAVER